MERANVSSALYSAPSLSLKSQHRGREGKAHVKWAAAGTSPHSLLIPGPEFGEAEGQDPTVSEDSAPTCYPHQQVSSRPTKCA